MTVQLCYACGLAADGHYHADSGELLQCCEACGSSGAVAEFADEPGRYEMFLDWIPDIFDGH